MSTLSPRQPTIEEIDARGARKRERFAELALIAPTPEMIREIMAFHDEASDASDVSGYAVIHVEPDRDPATVGQ